MDITEISINKVFQFVNLLPEGLHHFERTEASEYGGAAVL